MVTSDGCWGYFCLTVTMCTSVSKATDFPMLYCAAFTANVTRVHWLLWLRERTRHVQFCGHFLSCYMCKDEEYRTKDSRWSSSLRIGQGLSPSPFNERRLRCCLLNSSAAIMACVNLYLYRPYYWICLDEIRCELCVNLCLYCPYYLTCLD
jgi:hypothetical protein